MDPLIRIVYSEASGHCYVTFSYSESVDSLGLDLVPDDVWEKLPAGLPSDYFRDYDAFMQAQKPRSVYLRSFGAPKYQFTSQDGRYRNFMGDLTFARKTLNRKDLTLLGDYQMFSLFIISLQNNSYRWNCCLSHENL